MRIRFVNIKFFFIVIIIASIIFGGFYIWGGFIHEKIFVAIASFFRIITPVQSIGIFAGEIFNSNSTVLENDHSKILEADIMTLRDENTVLRRSLSLGARKDEGVVAASVFLYGRELGKEFLLLDRGSEDGVEVGDPVVDSNRVLVGLIHEVGTHQAKASIAANPGEIYEVEFIPLGVHAVAKGIGARTFSVELIPSDVSIRLGDFLILRKGALAPIFLGTVVHDEPKGGAALKEARAVMLADPEKNSFVFVLRASKSSK